MGVAGVTVTLTSKVFLRVSVERWQLQMSTVTNANGIFTFTDVLVGTYMLQVSPPAGYSVGTLEAVEVHVTAGTTVQAPASFLQTTQARWDWTMFLPLAGEDFVR